jgi:hypothetical protein
MNKNIFLYVSIMNILYKQLSCHMYSTKMIAVKIIDDRGSESLQVMWMET